MTTGHLNTTKTWATLRKEVEHELHLWGLHNYELPYKDDSARRGEVVVTIHRNGDTVPIKCSRFSDGYNGPERNLCAIREGIRSLRLLEQRGLWEMAAEVARNLKMLPEGLPPDDPHYVLGIRPEMPQTVKLKVYRELLIEYDPAKPTGSREKFDAVREAATKLGLI